jgi:hypothetical protein
MLKCKAEENKDASNCALLSLLEFPWKIFSMNSTIPIPNFLLVFSFVPKGEPWIVHFWVLWLKF